MVTDYTLVCEARRMAQQLRGLTTLVEGMVQLPAPTWSSLPSVTPGPVPRSTLYTSAAKQSYT